MRYLAVLAATFVALVLSLLGNGVWVLTERLHSESAQGVRMAQIRLLPADVRSALVRAYVRQMPDSIEVLVMGDSQTYGVNLPSRYSLGAALRSHMGPDVFNVSIIDGRFSDQRKVIQILKSERKRARHLVFNINPSHFKRTLVDEHHLPDTNGGSLPLALLTTADPAIYVRFPNVRRLKNRTSDTKFESVHTLDLYHEHVRPPLAFDPDRAPSGYYDDLDISHADGLRSFLIEAKEVADTIVVFSSPTYYKIYNQPPYNRNWDIRPIVEESLARCRSIAGIHCLDFSNLIPPEHFLDVVHLDAEGQQLLAHELARFFRRPGKTG